MRAVNAPPQGCAPSPFPPRVASATNYAMTWNLPNALTVLRLLAAPGVAVMFLYFHRPWADWFALSLFVLAMCGMLLRGWRIAPTTASPLRSEYFLT